MNGAKATFGWKATEKTVSAQVETEAAIETPVQVTGHEDAAEDKQEQ